MAASRYRAEYEFFLAKAWKALYAAREAAQLMGNFGADGDLFDLAEEVRRLQEDSLKGSARRRL